MKQDWEYKEEVLLSIAWKCEGLSPNFDFKTFEITVAAINDMQSKINCES